MELRGHPITAKELASELVHLPALMASWFEIPRSEARRMIAQDRVMLNGEPTAELDLPPDELQNLSFRLNA